MNYRKSLIPALILGLSIVLLAGPASAWEFSMDGVYTWQYDYLGANKAQMASLEPTTKQLNSGWQQLVSNADGAFAPYNFYTGGYKGTESSGGRHAAYGGLASVI